MTDPHGERALRRFHANRLRPLTDVPGMELPPGPDPALASYWVPREGSPLRPADLEIPFGRPADRARSLDAFWAGTPLAGLGRALVRLSRRFRGVRQNEEVSSYIYEMF